jgi:hypothetical protein
MIQRCIMVSHFHCLLQEFCLIIDSLKFFLIYVGIALGYGLDDRGSSSEVKE